MMMLLKNYLKKKFLKRYRRFFKEKIFVVGGRVGYADGPDDPGKENLRKL